MLLVPQWSQSSNRMLATASEPLPCRLGADLSAFPRFSRAPKKEGQVGVQSNPLMRSALAQCEKKGRSIFGLHRQRLSVNNLKMCTMISDWRSEEQGYEEEPEDDLSVDDGTSEVNSQVEDP